jgi:hypothetical protein
MIETPIDQAGSCGAGRKDPSPYECPTIEVNDGVSYLTGGYFVWILHRINNWLNYTDRLAEFQDGSIQNAETPIFSSPVPSPPLRGGEGVFGKYGLGAVGELVRERSRDRCSKIIAHPCRVEALRRRIIQNAPARYRGLPRSTWTITGGPFKFSDWFVNFSFHALNFISSGATKAVQASFSKGRDSCAELASNIHHTNVTILCPGAI